MSLPILDQERMEWGRQIVRVLQYGLIVSGKRSAAADDADKELEEGHAAYYWLHQAESRARLEMLVITSLS